MNLITPSADQLALAQNPPAARLFLQGPAGSGKTTIGALRLSELIFSGVPADQILVLVPQRTLAEPYANVLAQTQLPPGGSASIVTLGGLAQRQIELFWPLIAEKAGFGQLHQPPSFLTLETAQYYMAQVAAPLLDEGYFDTIHVDPNRIYSQILDNLNKASAVGFPYTEIADRLKAAWIGEASQARVYDEAQECAHRFRTFCLKNNLLDFSLQLEVFRNHLWHTLLCREYLQRQYRHLIYDNVEEDIPIAHDVVREWLPELDSALLIYDTQAGFRSFLGADPQSGAALAEACQEAIEVRGSWVTPQPIQALSSALEAIIHHQPVEPPPPQEIRQIMQVMSYSNVSQMADEICAKVQHLIEQQVTPGDIAILSPFLSDALRFALSSRFETLGIPARSHRPSRSLRDEPATLCLLTLARLAHPQWNLPCTRQDIRQALQQTIAGLDLVRADLMAQILYQPSQASQGLKPFDPIIPEMQERITFDVGGRYEKLRIWLKDYQSAPEVELDVFLSRLFGEILSQAGFGFHDNYDAAAVTARLIESVQKFRWSTVATLQQSGKTLGQEYLQMITDGVIAAQYLAPWQNQMQDAVLIAPAYTFLMYNRPTAYQFWLDIGSSGWWERLFQPLNHPYVLSKHWQGGPWTDVQEMAANQELLANLVRGLLRRCRSGVYLYSVRMNEQGDQQRGPLLVAVQSLLKHLARGEEQHV